MSLDFLTNYTGCIFDFDGTIILSEHVHMKAWEDLADELHLNLPVGFLEHSVGMSDQQLIKILARAWDYVLSEDQILERKRRFYMIRCPVESSVVPGVVDVIKRLHQRGVPLAIATSSSREEVLPVLNRLGISDFFKGVCTVEDITHPKPDPEIYNCAASRLNMPAKRCVAFEDSMAGVTSARAAGCGLVTVQTLYSAERLGPAILSVKDFTDIKLRGLLDTIGH